MKAAAMCVLAGSVSLLGQAVPPDETQPQHGSGTVLFSRSLADADKPAPQPNGRNATATDEERDALTFVAYDLDVRLMPKQESLAVRAKVTVRNDSPLPLKQIALQLSSMLNWEHVESSGGALQFSQHKLDSDADHTGSVNEAVIALPHPLAPQEQMKLDLLYSGQVPVNAKRLERIGAPPDVAEHSDWDRISPEFIGLRGFGNVIWYPVSARLAMLGDGAKLFHEMGTQKLRQSAAKMRMSVTGEFFADVPNIAVLDGHLVPVKETAAPEASFPGIVTASLPETTLGFAAPSLFLATRKEITASGVTVFSRAEDQVNALAFQTAANLATPLMQQWLGTKPKSALTVIDLPETQDMAAEEGSGLLAPVKSADPQALADTIIHSLSRAWLSSPRPWLEQGVAQFMATLWTEHTQGRQMALEQLESARASLALAEPATPGDAGAQDLIHPSDTIYYQAKAAYVLWMLRDVTSDAALAAALEAYAPEQDSSPDYFEHLLEKTSGKDLRWFFDAWVYHDRGLPDLSIAGVFPSRSATAGQYLVALDVANDGYADAEVPVAVRSGDTSVTERLLVPARSKVSHRILIQGLPTEVQVNDGTVPEVQASVHVQTLNAVASGK